MIDAAGIKQDPIKVEPMGDLATFSAQSRLNNRVDGQTLDNQIDSADDKDEEEHLNRPSDDDNDIKIEVKEECNGKGKEKK